MKILKLIFTFLLGIGVGIGLLFMLPHMNFDFEDPIYKNFGIQKFQIVGFLPYWALPNNDTNYNPQITTLSYFGLLINADGTAKFLVNPQEEEPSWTYMKGERFQERLAQSKAVNVRRSLLVQTIDEDAIAELIKTPEKSAQNMMNDVVPIMKKYGFNDLNVDIESFIEKENVVEDRAKFTTFLKEVRRIVDEQKLGTITVDVSPSVMIKDYIFDLQAIGEISDYIVLMTYDYNNVLSMSAGPVAPISGGNINRDWDIEVGLNEAIKLVPPHKLLLGIPTYGYDWETISDEPGAPTIPGGASTFSYEIIKNKILSCEECIKTKAFEPEAQEPYVVYQKPDQDYYHQLYYEDKEAIQKKIDLAKKYKLGGVAIWALGYEEGDLIQPLEEYKRYYEWK